MSHEVTVIGRIVWGTPLKAVPQTDDNGKPRTNAEGEPLLAWQFGLALGKPDASEFLAACKAATDEEFPAGRPDGFASKVKDGDKAKDAKGRPYAEMDGRANCWIVTCSTSLRAPVCSVHDGREWKPVTSGIKCGDFIKVVLTIKAHKAINARAKPGLYINPDGVGLWKIGKAISGGEFDANARFGGPPPEQAPQGEPPRQAAQTQPEPQKASQGASQSRHDAFLDGPDGKRVETPSGRTAEDDEIPF